MRDYERKLANAGQIGGNAEGASPMQASIQQPPPAAAAAVARDDAQSDGSMSDVPVRKLPACSGCFNFNPFAVSAHRHPTVGQTDQVHHDSDHSCSQRTHG